MLAASSFDDIIAITVFSVLVSITFGNISGGEGSSSSEIGKMIVMNILQIFVGIFVGSLIGFCMKAFNFCSFLSDSALNWAKFFTLLSIAIIAPYISHIAGFEESKYIGIIFMGYVCNRVWGEAKPNSHLAFFWKLCCPLLFGTIGASVEFSEIEIHIFGYSIIVISVSLLFRCLITYTVTIK